MNNLKRANSLASRKRKKSLVQQIKEAIIKMMEKNKSDDIQKMIDESW